MNQLLNQLEENLEAQLAIYNNLLSLAETQQEALVTRESDKLFQIADDQNGLLNQLHP